MENVGWIDKILLAPFFHIKASFLYNLFGRLGSLLVSFYAGKMPPCSMGSVLETRLYGGTVGIFIGLFPYVFWEADLDTFGHLNYETSQRAELFLFYSYASVSGGPLPIALVAGEATINFESMPATSSGASNSERNELRKSFLEIMSKRSIDFQCSIFSLACIYDPREVNVPDPVQTVCTRWGSDLLCFGSYSHVVVGASGSDYNKLGGSVGDGRVLFAEEATSRSYPATLHGAFLSGLREAANISKHANMKPMTMTMYTERRLLQDTESCADLLDDLFREPDLEFGKLSILFDPLSDGPQSIALLRVVVEGPRSEAINNIKSADCTSNKFISHQFQSQLNKKLKLYTLVAQKHAFELREVSRGDATKLC
ncbi:lysine-specific histone demethylase 1 homolog 3-like [Cryptomeria japonica]|uniref:lysine-specific histone demethylase 1 homolog 3-like n=1 Tax=Cryptomeria japonica TaxID=3369 RepID=UPI0025ABB53E|nr:lysine-specific histone demethylase 1 homolog 3-like [Cryptomeria japonica]